MDIGSQRKRFAVSLAPARADWPRQFADERALLAKELRATAREIVHVGSTAVPGLIAKPILDILVGVDDLSAAFTVAREPLQTIGYAYIHSFVNRDRLFFRKGSPEQATHHLHLVVWKSPAWSHPIAFARYLRASPEIARAYADLKQDLAARYPRDVDAYRAAKSDFVRATTARALAEGFAAT